MEPTNVYPAHRDRFSPMYYVEFNREEENEFTLFKRNFLHSKDELQKIQSELKIPDNYGKMLELTNEVHPYNMFSNWCGDKQGSMPNREWVKWMVDVLNSQSEPEFIKESNIMNTKEEQLELFGM